MAMAEEESDDLITVNLSYNNFTSFDVMSFAGNYELDKIETLKLGFNSLKDLGTVIVMSSFRKSTVLTCLDLGFNNISDQGAKHIGRFLQGNPPLKILYLSGNSLTPQGFEHISGSLAKNTTLEALYLTGNKAGEEGAKALCKGLQFNDSLNTLYVNGNKIGGVGCESFANLTKINSALTHINISDNDVGDYGMEHLSKTFLLEDYQKSLKILVLSFNKIGSIGICRLCESLKGYSQMEKLMLNSNQICDDGAYALAEALPTMTSLQELDVGYGGVCSEGMMVLLEVIQNSMADKTGALKVLTLSGNVIDNIVARKISEIVAVGNSLSKLFLDLTHIGSSGQKIIAAALASNDCSALSKITGFPLGAILGTLHLPAYLSKLSNEAVLNCLALMWRLEHQGGLPSLDNDQSDGAMDTTTEQAMIVKSGIGNANPNPQLNPTVEGRALPREKETVGSSSSLSSSSSSSSSSSLSLSLSSSSLMTSTLNSSISTASFLPFGSSLFKSTPNPTPPVVVQRAEVCRYIEAGADTSTLKNTDTLLIHLSDSEKMSERDFLLTIHGSRQAIATNSEISTLAPHNSYIIQALSAPSKKLCLRDGSSDGGTTGWSSSIFKSSGGNTISSSGGGNTISCSGGGNTISSSGDGNTISSSGGDNGSSSISNSSSNSSSSSTTSSSMFNMNVLRNSDSSSSEPSRSSLDRDRNNFSSYGIGKRQAREESIEDALGFGIFSPARQPPLADYKGEHCGNTLTRPTPLAYPTKSGRRIVKFSADSAPIETSALPSTFSKMRLDSYASMSHIAEYDNDGLEGLKDKRPIEKSGNTDLCIVLRDSRELVREPFDKQELWRLTQYYFSAPTRVDTSIKLLKSGSSSNLCTARGLQPSNSNSTFDASSSDENSDDQYQFNINRQASVNITPCLEDSPPSIDAVTPAAVPTPANQGASSSGNKKTRKRKSYVKKSHSTLRIAQFPKIRHYLEARKESNNFEVRKLLILRQLRFLESACHNTYDIDIDTVLLENI